jgi:uncharacterized protein (DUF1697 family)
MTAFTAMLRAVNLGGGSTLPSAQLKRIGEECGFDKVRTFIASGNLLLVSKDGESAVRKAIETKAGAFFGKAVAAHVRNAAELADVVAENPFADRPGNRTIALFIDDRPELAMIEAATNVGNEEIALGPRVLYISYDEDMGRSKLRLPAMKSGTGRNMNSVAKMAGLLADME